jgi:hypothetical protein
VYAGCRHKGKGLGSYFGHVPLVLIVTLPASGDASPVRVGGVAHFVKPDFAGKTTLYNFIPEQGVHVQAGLGTGAVRVKGKVYTVVFHSAVLKKAVNPVIGYGGGKNTAY